MLQHQGKQVQNIAKRLSKIKTPSVALSRMVQILKSNDLRGYPRVGYYVPNIGFLVPSVVPGPEFFTIELTAPVHRMMLDMMGYDKFTVLKQYSRVMGIIQKVTPPNVEGAVQLSKLIINCEPVVTLNVNLD